MQEEQKQLERRHRQWSVEVLPGFLHALNNALAGALASSQLARNLFAEGQGDDAVLAQVEGSLTQSISLSQALQRALPRSGDSRRRFDAEQALRSAWLLAEMTDQQRSEVEHQTVSLSALPQQLFGREEEFVLGVLQIFLVLRRSPRRGAFAARPTRIGLRIEFQLEVTGEGVWPWWTDDLNQWFPSFDLDVTSSSLPDGSRAFAVEFKSETT